ncbi:hypothetical protein HDU83_000049 [Entophlyctis luteolus]|nr:hypothetical protein HDU83_000049 [Entophlyctis luteolus]
MKRVLAAFDFDFTLVDNDSDHYVFDKLSPVLRTKMTDVCFLSNNVLTVLRKPLSYRGLFNGLTWCTIEFNPAIIKMCEAIRSAGGDIIIVSDANTIYIDEIAKYITEIVTNPGTWSETGRLHVQRRVKAPEVHGCTNVCSVNLCKGKEILERMKEYDMIIYGGDGRNDYCPMTKLGGGDFALARKGFSLEKLLDSDPKYPAAIQARLLWWNEADDLLAHVESILKG